MVFLDIWVLAAAAMALTSVSLSLYAITRHLCNFSQPYLQKYIIRILWMVPIYSMNAWIAMLIPATGLYLDSFREIYESFVIYSFMEYLLNFLKYDTNLQQYIDHKPGPKHIFPFCLLPSCAGGSTFMVRCKHGILQYVVVRPTTSLIAFASKLFDFYGEGNYNPFSGYTYPVLLIVNNVSQVMAMYCLVIFYSGYQHELAPMRPLTKFFSIKLVVFFSFFQSVLISGLMEIQAVQATFRELFPELSDNVELGRKLQEFLICFDMLVAAIGHQFAFSHKPFVEDDYEAGLLEENLIRHRRFGRGSKGCCEAFRSTLDFSDERNDLWEHLSHIFNRLRSLFSRKMPLPAIVSSPSPIEREDGELAIKPAEAAANQLPAQKHNHRNQNYQTID